LKIPPSIKGCQLACGSTESIRSAANHEYGDIAPKYMSGGGAATTPILTHARRRPAGGAHAARGLREERLGTGPSNVAEGVAL
jgi:hypothetical protein